ncbi:MAG: 50S ribosomal protein L23, partial [Bacteroidales bacterium]|nr:50S ribosomal protein L23 [Bacteroidales bacterium]
YAFIVDVRANKLQIKKAVQDLYGVQVSSVNTMRYDGKLKSRYTKAGVISGRRDAFKKAIVTLAKGETIDFFSNI